MWDDGAAIGRVDGGTEWVTYDDFLTEFNKGPSKLYCDPGKSTGGYTGAAQTK